MTMLADLVEVVIGVDTHKHSHTAAVLDARTGAVLARATVPADPDGYAQLSALAEQHSGLRAWAMEGAGGYGAGLARHLAVAEEQVIELDRPKRPTRKAGAKSDPIDAERAARDALARTRFAAPKSGATRAALQLRLTARRSAVEATGDAQRQLQAIVVTAPEVVRARFRGQRTPAMVTTALALRPATTTGDEEVLTALTVLQALARRIRDLRAEATEHEKPSPPSPGPGGRTYWTCPGSDRSWPPPCSPPGLIPAAATARARSRCSPASLRSPPHRA